MITANLKILGLSLKNEEKKTISKTLRKKNKSSCKFILSFASGETFVKQNIINNSKNYIRKCWPSRLEHKSK